VNGRMREREKIALHTRHSIRLELKKEFGRKSQLVKCLAMELDCLS
jgi:hypothetical protein